MATPIPVHHVASPHCRFRPEGLSNGMSDNTEEGSILTSSPVDPLEWQKCSRSGTGLRKHRKFRGKPLVQKGDPDTTPPPSKICSFKSKCELNPGDLLEAKDDWLDNGKQVLQSFTPSKATKHHFISNLELQQCFHKFHCDLMKELKDLKLSLSRQIMNLQLDVDKILANQNQESQETLGFKGLLSHHQRRYGPCEPAGPNEKMDFQTYASRSTKQEVARPPSTSSVTGEDCLLPALKYESHRKLQDDSWQFARGATLSHKESSERLRSSQLDTRAFQNLQNNPIFHDTNQTNSEKNFESSDSNISSSCEADSKSEDDEVESSLDIEAEHAGYMESNSDTLSRREFLPQFPAKSDEEHRKIAGAHPLKTYAAKSDFEIDLNQSRLKADRHVMLRDPDCNLLNHDRRDGGLIARHDKIAKTKGSNNGSITEHDLQPKILADHDNHVSRMPRTLEQYNIPCKLRKDGINNLLNLVSEIDSLQKAADEKVEEGKYFSGPILTETAKKLVRDDSSLTPAAEPTCGNGVKDEVQSLYLKGKLQNLESKEKFVEPEWTPHSKGSFHRSNYAEGGKIKSQSDKSISGDEEEDSHNRKYAMAKSKHRSTTTQSDNTSRVQHYETVKKARRTVLPGKADDVDIDHIHGENDQQRDSVNIRNEFKQPSTRNEAHSLENHDGLQPFTLKGWSAAFLDSHCKASAGAKLTYQNLTVSSRLDHLVMVPTSAAIPNVEDLQLGKASQKEEPQHTEKENKNQYDQNAIRQLSGKSSKGGCAWTVIEPPMTPKSTLKGAQGNGSATPTSKARPKHHYLFHN